MADYTIAELSLGKGMLGLGPIPGRSGQYASDLNVILTWKADLVLTMTMAEELTYVDAEAFGEDLTAAGVTWLHLPIGDMNAPSRETQSLWPAASRSAHQLFDAGGRVFTHCFGGCGRAGMASLRLMVEAGESPADALARLRSVRPCAIETQAQFDWASAAGLG